MKITANEIRIGNVLEYKNRLWVVSKIQHTQPGKGGAYVQTELKDIKSGTKLNERFRSGETIEKARLDEEERQFLYQDGDLLTFMDPETFEQVSVNQELAGEPVRFIQEGMTVTIVYYEGEALSVKLPDSVVVEVVEAEPVVKGQTASSSYKPAILENGVRVLVPPHIDAGTRIVINPQDGTYIERAKD
ncbi:MAG: elongation factor P [Rickettsiales bacterium]|nr:elongation factor P [Rickettsiales bacterium]|tara:strand:- start:26933 stop:27499 length:567 start_codon:yes stop_codon:yes gene_type:complete